MNFDLYRYDRASRPVKAGSISASVSILDSRIGINQHIVDQEEYQRMPSFVGPKGVGFIAPGKE